MEIWESEPNHWEGENMVINRTETTGCLCGYVGIPESHPWYGKNYSDAVKVSPSVMEREFDIDRVGALNLLCATDYGDDETMDMFLAVDVHGCLTYSNDSAPGKESEDDLWWFGFDCGHAGDYAPEMRSYSDNDVYRDFEYVKGECIALAKQLAKFAA